MKILFVSLLTMLLMSKIILILDIVTTRSQSASEQFAAIDQIMKKSACVLLGRNEAIRRSSEIKKFVSIQIISIGWWICSRR